MTEQEERAERIAKAFHAAYEELAPEHGYTTREASRKLWAEVPARNRGLMIGTVKRLMHTEVIADPAQLTELREALERTYRDSVDPAIPDDDFREMTGRRSRSLLTHSTPPRSDG